MIKNNEIDEIIMIEKNKTLSPIIKYEYDVEIKRKVIKQSFILINQFKSLDIQ